MATITITVPNPVAQRVLDAFSATYGWSSTLPNGEPNPETQAAFAQRQLREHVRDVVRAHEARTAAESARQTALARADADIALT